MINDTIWWTAGAVAALVVLWNILVARTYPLKCSCCAKRFGNGFQDVYMTLERRGQPREAWLPPMCDTCRRKVSELWDMEGYRVR